MSLSEDFIELSLTLDRSGLIWYPEIGDEISIRETPERVSILVDPEGLTPTELRKAYVWLPSVEQFVTQFEARQAFLYHAGIGPGLAYEAVLKTAIGMIETEAATLRLAFGKALHMLLTKSAGMSSAH